MRLLRPVCPHRVSRDIVPGLASVIDHGKELSSPGEPLALEHAPFHCIGTALNRFLARACRVDSFPTFVFFRDAELHCLAFSYAPHGLPWVFPNDCCMVNKDAPMDVFDCVMASH